MSAKTSGQNLFEKLGGVGDFFRFLTPERQYQYQAAAEAIENESFEAGYAQCERDGSSLRQQVTEFHRAMEVPILDKPQVPSDERVKLRVRLIAEEFFEFLEAVGFEILDMDGNPIIANYMISKDCLVNMVEVADALADLDYVIEGTRLEFGIDGAPIAEAVHAANMAKARGPVRADGKRLKPPGWKPPDIEGELRKQGWEGK